MTVTVVGAGFAGLTLSHELNKRGVDVRIVERGPRAGGLLRTLKTAEGLVETGANALINDQNVERLFAELNLVRAVRLPSARRRLIFWNKPQRWPIGLKTTARLGRQMLRLRLGEHSLKPQSDETLRAWGERFVNVEFVDRLLAPALQGVYAGTPERLSATLTAGNFFGPRPPRGRERGSVAPLFGMGEIIDKLSARLSRQIEYDHAYVLPPVPQGPVVLTTSAWAAAELLSETQPALSRQLHALESLPLTTVTLFYEPDPSDPSGFGCLFPRAQKFGALGVLFNSDIFAGRGPFRSETWILGADLDEAAALAMISTDRTRLTGRERTPRAHQFTRWPRAIPYYTTAWEATLKELSVAPPVYLHGNYLGRLGLARIYEDSIALAERLAHAPSHR